MRRSSQADRGGVEAFLGVASMEHRALVGNFPRSPTWSTVPLVAELKSGSERAFVSSQRALLFLRRVGWAEGISFLLLLGVAMPLKYWAGIAVAVKAVGWLHGALFMALLFALGRARLCARLPAGTCLAVLLASLLPFGPFLIERSLARFVASENEINA